MRNIYLPTSRKGRNRIGSGKGIEILMGLEGGG